MFPFSACEKAAEKVAFFLVSLPFTVKTGFSEQVIQSSVRGRHGYNLNQLIENEKNVTLPFEMISIIFMQICNATAKDVPRRLSMSAQRQWQGNGYSEVSPVPCRILP